MNGGKYSQVRLRRLRKSAGLRSMLQETCLSVDDFIMPLFVVEGQGITDEVSSMPGQYRYSVDQLPSICGRISSSGVRSVLLFGIAGHKDETGSSAWDDNGVVASAVRLIKKDFPDLIVITDVCLCAYTDHGHCGILEQDKLLNDQTLTYLAKMATCHALAGADFVAPSDMMDGRVGFIRDALDESGFGDTGIISYSSKFSSAFYGPFRDAADSSPAFGDRKTYQMNPANFREAVRESLLDEREGADMLMVKPALAYLDVIRGIRESSLLPLVCYNVSGEYSMVKAAAEKGWIDEKAVVLESLQAMKRAGADLIITYHALDAAGWLKEN